MKHRLRLLKPEAIPQKDVHKGRHTRTLEHECPTPSQALLANLSGA